MPWQQGKHGPAEDRFWSFVQVGDTWRLSDHTPCWRWTGWTNLGGYGGFMLRGEHRMAHRWSYERFVGPIPTGYEVDHLCRNRWCVNPLHLEAVTKSENMRRAARPTCPHGHLMSGSNVRMRKRPSGQVHRECRLCERERNHRRKRPRKPSTR